MTDFTPVVSTPCAGQKAEPTAAAYGAGITTKGGHLPGRSLNAQHHSAPLYIDC